MQKRGKEKRREVLLWSIALPGFGQLLNGQFFKGALLIILEFVVNVMSHFNKAIQLSFIGETRLALDVIDMGWLMFYPCLYFFSMWDAYREAGGEFVPRYYYLPFAFGAFFVTTGLMYAPIVQLFGIFPGPVFLPMLSLIPGLFVGFFIRSLLLRLEKKEHIL